MLAGTVAKAAILFCELLHSEGVRDRIRFGPELPNVLRQLRVRLVDPIL